MNKSQLIEELSETAFLSSKDAEIIVNIFFNSISNGLIDGERVELRGFGSFKVKHYEGYTGRNPKNGEAIQVEPKKLPFFKVGKELKCLVDDE